MDKPPIITYELVTGQLKLILACSITYALAKGYLTAVDATALTTVLTAAGSLAIPFLWSAYSNARTKKVPANSVAIDPHTPGDASAAIGANVAGKVVGALLLAIMLNSIVLVPSFAQTRPLVITPPQRATAVAPAATAGFLDIIRNWVSSDIDGAIALSTAIPELQDPTGAACWKTFRGIGDVITAHPLPLTLKLASDVQSARLVSMALKKVCLEPACAQVWMDMQNQVAALAPIGVPFTLASICSKVL